MRLLILMSLCVSRFNGKFRQFCGLTLLLLLVSMASRGVVFLSSVVQRQIVALDICVNRLSHLFKIQESSIQVANIHTTDEPCQYLKANIQSWST